MLIFAAVQVESDLLFPGSFLVSLTDPYLTYSLAMDSRITLQDVHNLSHLAPSSCSEKLLGQDNDAQGG